MSVSGRPDPPAPPTDPTRPAISGHAPERGLWVEIEDGGAAVTYDATDPGPSPRPSRCRHTT